MSYCYLLGRLVCRKLSWGRGGGATISVKVQQKLRKFPGMLHVGPYVRTFAFLTLKSSKARFPNSRPLR